MKNKKEELINQYEIRVELARLERKKLRRNVLSQTLYCIKNARSTGEIDACKANEQRTLMNYIDKDFDNSKKFVITRNRLLIEYTSKYRKESLLEKKQMYYKTLDCVKRARSLNSIKSCKSFEDSISEKIYFSFDDNPRLKNLIDKDALIDRYEIRIEMAKLDRNAHKVNIFSKTLQCFKNSRSKHDIYSCKKNEKDRIIKLIKS